VDKTPGRENFGEIATVATRVRKNLALNFLSKINLTFLKAKKFNQEKANTTPKAKTLFL